MNQWWRRWPSMGIVAMIVVVGAGRGILWALLVRA